MPFISEIDLEALDVLLTVDASPGDTFQIYVSQDLATWAPIPGQGNLTAGIHRVQGELATGERKFYRVE